MTDAVADNSDPILLIIEEHDRDLQRLNFWDVVILTSALFAAMVCALIWVDTPWYVTVSAWLLSQMSLHIIVVRIGRGRLNQTIAELLHLHAVDQDSYLAMVARIRAMPHFSLQDALVFTLEHIRKLQEEEAQAEAEGGADPESEPETGAAG